MEENTNICFKDIYKEDAALPSRLEKDYALGSCLAASAESQVFLIKNRETEERLILKYRSGNRAEFLKKEYEILKKLQKDFLPRVYDCFEEEGVWLLREYIPGQTLQALVERQGAYSVRQAVAAMSAICKNVAVLHEQNPPLVHRDIKPENILVTDTGAYKFIDMDTVREYKENESSDTVYIGTRQTAAPEQFGYQQTSVRTDIYSLGILFLYLLTGQYTVYCPEWKCLPSSIKQTINRCLSFDPAGRYPSVKALMAELACIRRFSMRRRTMAVLITSFLLVLMAAGGFTFNQIKDYRYKHQSVAFVNPQIEKAARDALGKGEKDTVTPSELSNVTTLILCGDRIFDSWQEHEMYHANYWYEFMEEETRTEPADLKDLSYFPKLHTLVLDNQGLVEIQDLKKLPLERLSLQKNQLQDLSGIKNMQTLSYLLLIDNPLSTLENVASCSNLRTLKISNTLITDLTPLKGLSLTSLDTSWSLVTDFSAIAKMENLTSLIVSSASSEDVEKLRNLKHLKMLGLMECDVEDMSQFMDFKELENIDLTGCGNVTSLDWLKNFPALSYLGIARTGITDISAVRDDRALEIVDLNGTPVKDFTPLKDVPLLNSIFIDSGKEAAVYALELENVEVFVAD